MNFGFCLSFHFLFFRTNGERRKSWIICCTCSLRNFFRLFVFFFFSLILLLQLLPLLVCVFLPEKTARAQCGAGCAISSYLLARFFFASEFTSETSAGVEIRRSEELLSAEVAFGCGLELPSANILRSGSRNLTHFLYGKTEILIEFGYPAGRGHTRCRAEVIREPRTCSLQVDECFK